MRTLALDVVDTKGKKGMKKEQAAKATEAPPLSLGLQWQWRSSRWQSGPQWHFSGGKDGNHMCWELGS